MLKLKYFNSSDLIFSVIPLRHGICYHTFPLYTLFGQKFPLCAFIKYLGAVIIIKTTSEKEIDLFGKKKNYLNVYIYLEKIFFTAIPYNFDTGYLHALRC